MMNLTPEQLDQFKSAYAEMIVDRADLDSLMNMCYDMLMDSYKDFSEGELVDEILDLYDEDTLADLIPEIPVSEQQRDLYQEVLEYQRQGGKL